jgi:hypothetical protein
MYNRIYAYAYACVYPCISRTYVCMYREILFLNDNYAKLIQILKTLLHVKIKWIVTLYYKRKNNFIVRSS